MRKIILITLILLMGIIDTPLKKNVYAQLTSVEIGTGSSRTNVLPMNMYHKNSFNQMIYYKSEIGRAGYIGAIAFNKATTETHTVQSLTIWIATTTDSILTDSSWVSQSAMKKVFHATNYTIPNTSGEYLITLDSSYYYDGTENLAIIVSRKDNSYNKSLTFNYNNTPNSCLYRRSDSDPSYGDYSGEETGTVTSTRPNIKLYMNDRDNFCFPLSSMSIVGIDESSIEIELPLNANGLGYEVAITELIDNNTSIDIATPNQIYSNSHTFTGLNAGTDYVIGARNLCADGVYSEWLTTTTRTTATATELPFICDFEAEDSWINWQLENDSYTNHWVFGDKASSGEESINGMYISNDTSDLKRYEYSTNKKGTVLAKMLINFPTVGEYNIKYDWKCNGENSWDFMRVALFPATYGPTLIASSDLPSGVSATSLPNDVIALDGGEKLNQSMIWNTYTTIANITTTGNYYLVVLWRNDGSGGNNPPAAIDNISIEEALCTSAENITIENITNTSATIMLESSSSNDFNLYYREYGTEQYDTIAISSPYNLTNLKSGTYYEGLIRTNCGTNGESFSLTEFQFGTECSTINLPWAYGGESSMMKHDSGSETYPYCWENINGSTSNDYWKSNTSRSNVHSGQQTLYFYGNSSVSKRHDDWLISPTITFTGNEEMCFWVKTGSSSNSPSYHGRFALYASTDEATSITDTTHFIKLSITGTNVINNYVDFVGNDWQKITIQLPNTLIGDHYLAFVVKDTNSFSFSLDDIYLYTSTSCAMPEDIHTTIINSTSATITWHSDANSFIVYYGAPGFEIENALIATSNENNITLTELTPNTDYEFRVIATCEDGISSPQSTPISFTTTCTPISNEFLPFTEDFSDNATGSNSQLDDCWFRGTNHSSTYPYVYESSYNNIQHCLYFYSSSSVYSYVALPEFEAEINDLMITCSVRRHTSATYNSNLILGLMSNPYDINTFSPIDTLCPENLGEWSDFQLSLGDVDATAGRYIAFMLPAGLTGYSYLDNIIITTRGICETPENPTVTSISSNSVNISWTDTIATNWIVYYGEPGFEIDTVSNPISCNTTSAEITGLQPMTSYEFVVMATCGDGSYSAPSLAMQFTTTCATINELPYFEDFESYNTGSTESINPCWSKYVIGNVTQYPYPTNSAAITGNRGLYFDSYESSSSKFNCYAVMPMFQEPITNLKLKFSMKNKVGTALNTTYTSTMVLGIMSNPEDLETFDTIAIYSINSNIDGTVRTYEYLFNNYVGDGQYITFLAPDVEPGDASSIDNIFSLDDIEVDVIPICQRPTAMTGTTGTTTANLTWVGNASSYEVSYSLNEDMSDSTTIIVNENSVQLTGLNSYTIYYVNVNGICGEDRSEWMIEPLMIRTQIDCGSGYENFIDTIGIGLSSGSSYTINGNHTYTHAHNWIIYTKEELAEMGLVSFNNIIKSIFVDVEEAGSAMPLKVYMAETPLYEFENIATDTIPLSSMLLVYDDTITFDPYEWNELLLETPFSYSDTNNLMIAFDRHGEISTSTNFYYGGVSDYKTAYIYHNRDNNSYAFRKKYRGNMIFNICGDVPSCIRPRNIVKTNVTSNSISLTWTGTASSYEIAYSSDANFNPDNATAENISISNNNRLTLPNLIANTTYYIYIRSICGAENSIWSNSIIVTTPCDAIDLPYSENFDSYPASTIASGGQTIDPCWVKGTNNSTLYPFVTTSESSSGANSLKFYASNAFYSYAALPMFSESITNTMMTLKALKISSQGGVLEIGVMVDPHDINTFQSVTTIQPTEKDVWENFEINFANYTGTGKFISIKSQLGATANTFIDNIEVFSIPTCQSPINVTVSSITSSTAVVTWNDRSTSPTNNYELEYGIAGFTLGHGTRISSNTNPTTLTGLTAGTDYEVYVRSLCSSTDESRWSFCAQFNTECGAMTLPLIYNFENFESGTSAPLPHCFYRYNDASSSYYKNYPYINGYSSNAHSGHNSIYYNLGTASSNPNNAAMIFPEIDTIDHPMNGNQMIFWAKSGSAPSNVIIGINKNPTTINTFVPIDTIALTPNYTEYIVSFANYIGTGNHPTILIQKNSEPQSVYIDDVTIEEIPACPRVLDLIVITATEATAMIDWTDTIGTTQWIVDYRKADSNHYQSIITTTHPFTLTGLTANTQYYFNVRPICTSGDTSLALNTDGSFWTTQIPATLPYNYDFENAAEWANWQNNSNSSINWYRGDALAGQGSYSMYISNDEGATNSTNWNSIVNAVAYRDIDFGTDTSSFTMNFKAKVGGTIAHNYDGVSVMLVDPTESVIASTDGLNTPWGHVNDLAMRTIRHDSIWETYQVHFEHIAGVHRVAFYWFNQATGNNNPYVDQPGAIDSITIAEQTCKRPYDLTVSNVEAYTATLNWEGEATSYEVSYRTSGADPSTDVNQITTGNSLNISNLEASTQYVFWVRAICSDSDTSYWSDGKSFKTICTRYLASDTIRENFTDTEEHPYNDANGILPDCWEAYSNGTKGILPHVVGSGSYWFTHDDKALIMTSGSSYGDTSIVRLPYTEEAVNTLTMSYWMCTESDGYGLLEVGYLDGTDIAHDFVVMKKIHASEASKYNGTAGNQPSNIGIYDTIHFDSVPSTAQAIAFRWIKRSTFYSVCLDDIVVTANITCPTPTITNTMVDYESALLTWNDSASNYQLLYKEVTATTWSDTIATTENSYTLNGLTPETDYIVQLRALCGEENGNSTWTEIEFTTDVLPCFIPTNLIVTETGYETVTLNWESEGNATQWIVNVFNSTSNIMDTVDSKPATIMGLYANVEYQVAVKSLCSSVIESEWSDTINFTTMECSTATNVATSKITNNSATITWDSPEAMKWEINYGDSGFGQGQGELAEVTERTYTITGLEPETDYDVYVRLYCTENTYGVWSNLFSFTTEAEEIPEGIDGIEGNFSFTIYPNPTNNTTTISLNGIEGKVEISVVDMNGRIIMSEAMECGNDCEKRMDIDGLAQGTYFVKVISDGINSVRKLIVR